MPAHDPYERRVIASIAGLARSARESGTDRLAKANQTYRDSFNVGHECAMCKRIDIDQSLAPEEIRRRGDALYRLHMRRLRLRQQTSQRRAAQAAADVEAVEAMTAEQARAVGAP